MSDSSFIRSLYLYTNDPAKFQRYFENSLEFFVVVAARCYSVKLNELLIETENTRNVNITTKSGTNEASACLKLRGHVIACLCLLIPSN